MTCAPPLRAGLPSERSFYVPRHSVKTSVVYNTYDPSWTDCCSLFWFGSLRELLQKRIRIQAFHFQKNESEPLGECEVRPPLGRTPHHL
jgi:hypothetical protein